MLREKFKEHYNPRAMAIGPIHHYNMKSDQLDDLKWKLAAKFVKIQERKDLLVSIKTSVPELKNLFDREVIETRNISDESLARMLFLDGCAMLQFIYSFVNDELKEFQINNSQAALIEQDLFLLENQMPFQVLLLLMPNDEIRAKIMESIGTFIYKNILAPQDDVYGCIKKKNSLPPIQTEANTPRPEHLLDLLRSALLDDVPSQRSRKIIAIIKIPIYIFLGFFLLVLLLLCICCFCYGCLSNMAYHRDSSQEKETSPPADPSVTDDPEDTDTNCNCVDQFVEKIIDNCAQCLKRFCKFPEYRLSFRSVHELKARGIKLKPSKITSMKAISFKTQWFGMKGVLELPPLQVDNSTVCKLWNLVAYEMCPDNLINNYAVTSYLSFLDSLIDTEQDVKDLRSVHILCNRLSTDAEVANVFNTIGSHLLYDDKTYHGVKNKIQTHYQRRYAFWMAQVNRDYFSSPWTIMALSAAVIALLFTGIQTWYAVHPKH